MPPKITTATTRPSPKPAAKTTKPEVKSAKPKANAIKPLKAVIVQSPTREQISLRAYEIWLRKGRPLGQDQKNWLEAEAELKAGA